MADKLTVLSDDLELTATRLRNVAHARYGVDAEKRDEIAWNRSMLDLTREAQHTLVDMMKALVPMPPEELEFLKEEAETAVGDAD